MPFWLVFAFLISIFRIPQIPSSISDLPHGSLLPWSVRCRDAQLSPVPHLAAGRRVNSLSSNPLLIITKF